MGSTSRAYERHLFSQARDPVVDQTCNEGNCADEDCDGEKAAYEAALKKANTPVVAAKLIGVAGDAETKGWVAAFRKRLDELGWRVGGNLQIEERWTAGDPDSNRAFAGELVAVKPDAIFAFSSVAVVALQHESRTVPIVFNSQSCS